MSEEQELNVLTHAPVHRRHADHAFDRRAGLKEPTIAVLESARIELAQIKWMAGQVLK